MHVYIGDRFIYGAGSEAPYTYIVTQQNDRGGIWLSEVYNGRVTPVSTDDARPDWTPDTVANVMNGANPNWRYVPCNPLLTLPVGV